MNHIKRTTEENKAWCGAELDGTFHFKDTEAAVINGAYGQIRACQRCTDTVRAYLVLGGGGTNEI